MKLKAILLSFIFLSFIGYKQLLNKNENISSLRTEIAPTQNTPDHLIDWMNAVNGHDTAILEKSYHPSAVMIISSDSIINNAAEIANYYSIQKNKVTSIQSLFSVEANKTRGINYELVKYEIDGIGEFVQIVIWSVKDKGVIREFEFTTESDVVPSQVDTTQIGKRRKSWIELCNLNSAKNLVNELYSSNTIYFNHKPIVQGRKDLIQEYGYMNNENYSLRLHPIKLELVNSYLAFEIGQCSGSYNGKYVLVWKKESDGNWKIYIDSNI